ncbi:3-hydroxypropanoate dehydrogenase [Rhizomicrobium palustre]|uniref:Putative NADH dehydrogenase/NAD(P)H nitroreductase FHS83_001448 n=1 Tax=Rhizomicrobium palustre TaxID=189966 RepID=A0A846MYS7_9PROT|nr:malonic semialdehyde reductase [Rhizomicrobium palustre]NIK88130.1 3-hydroxypropanoate dehydrogenase [Rhizomicrobium palustre]
MAINDEALDRIFRTARSHRAWLDKPVSPALLMAIYDLLRFGPTALNSNPLRIVFVTSPEAKARLVPHLAPGNVEKTVTAPATAILGYDTEFPKKMGKLTPHNPTLGETLTNTAENEITAFRNGSLQGAYFIIAARALGLDCGPMSGFSNEGVDAEFFAGTGVKSNFLCNVGYGDAAKLHARAPRLSFDEACTIV